MIITTYIIRIYKCEKNKPRRLVGVVEKVGVKGQRAFTNYDELWEILNSPMPPLSSLHKERRRLRGHMHGNKLDKRR
jgi:hypothetical protein